MRRPIFVIVLLSLAATVPSTSLAASVQVRTTTSEVFEIAGEFRPLYDRLGGVDSLGEPITRPYYLGDTLVQYFPRARLERSGRSASTPMGVNRLSALGRLLAQLTGDSVRLAFQPTQPTQVINSGLYISETQHLIKGPILDYWSKRGGLARFGPPISEEYRKGSGSIQWFASAVLEVADVSSSIGSVGEREVGREFIMFSRDERDAIESIPPLYARDLVDPANGLNVPIIYLHKIEDERLFEDQIVGLLSAGYTPISLARLVRSLTCCATLPPAPIVFTFDDGWKSQIEVALPALLRYRIPATFFVLPTFDRKEDRHLTIDDFRTLVDAGMSVQSHTLNHANLPVLLSWNPGAAQAEVVESRRILEKIGGVDYFAYPFGALDPATIELVTNAGYLAAVSTRFGCTHFRQDLMKLSRVAVNPSATASLVIASLAEARNHDELRLR